MNKVLYILIVLVLINSCGGGGGGGSASIPEGYSKVQINIGSFQVSTSSVPVATPQASTTVPAGVHHLVFYDVRSLFPLNMSLIREFDVSQGLNEIFGTLMANGFHIVYVQALDSSGHIRYVGARAIILVGGRYYIPIQMVPFSELAPEFGGLESIDGITTNSMTLHWSPATDDTTPQDQMQYLGYMSLTPGGENFGTPSNPSIPSFTTDPGQTSFTVTGLSPNTTYYFVVRAMDQATNTDSNTVERSATTLAGTGGAGTAPVFGGLISATALSTTDIALTWGQATDDDTPPSDIRYPIFMATQPGGEDYANPWRVVKGATSTTIRGLQPNTNYCFVARARDLAGNTDSNTVEKCTTTFSLPPLPAGLYVNAVTGNDTTGNGSPGAPFMTITKALSVTLGNETIYVAAGTYDATLGETFPLALKTGTVLNCASTATVIIIANSTIAAITGANNARINNCTVGLSSTATAIAVPAINDSGTNLLIDGCGITSSVPAGIGVGVSMTGLSTVRNSTLRSSSGDGIQVNSNAFIQNNQIDLNGTGILIQGGSPSIQGNVITTNTNYGINFVGPPGSSPAVSNNQIYCNSVADLRAFSPTTTVNAPGNYWDANPPSYGGGSCSGGVDQCSMSFPWTLTPIAGVVASPCPYTPPIP